MPVLLRRSSDYPGAGAFDAWFAVTGTEGRGPADKKVAELGQGLDDAFNSICPEWWSAGKALADGPGAELAYATICSCFASDFGLMMAWARLTEDAARKKTVTLVLCDDPWLFRHLAALPGVKVGKMPGLWPVVTKLRLRGITARLGLIGRLIFTALATRRQRVAHRHGDAAILVYGHPRSTADGYDDYFGPLMRDIPALKRLLHTDCGTAQAAELAADGRTASLHAWGSPWRTPGLLFQRWRPKREHLEGKNGWLVRRAADNEGSGAAHAMNVWQRQCQKSWLARVRPMAVAWPWENYGWERDLCRQARRLGVATIGYQHTAIGPHQLNHSPITNVDGEASLPDVILCDGPAYRNQLIEWGIPAGRLAIGGSLRIDIARNDLYNPLGPVFVALSGVLAIARQQIEAARKIAASGRRVLIKEHPMYPIEIEDTDSISKTDLQLSQQAGLSAVLYSTGISGLEAILSGVPAVRLLLEDRIAIDVLPATIKAPAAAGDIIADTVARIQKPESCDWDQVLSPVDMKVWRSVLTPK